MSIEAMKQALEALELIQRDIQWHDNSPTFKLVNNTVNALRTAIQQTEAKTDEPVLTVEKEPDYWSGGHFHKGDRPHIDPTKVWGLPIGTKLYTHPAPGVPVMNVRCEGCGYMTHHREHMGCVRAAKQFTHPAPGVPDDVVKDAERYRWLRDSDHWPAPFASSQDPEPVRGTDLDAAIDAAMTAARAQKGQP